MDSSTTATRHGQRKVVPLQLTTNREETTRKCHSLTTLPSSASTLSATLSSRTHSGGRLSPAQIASFKTKIRTYSTDTSAAYTRSPAFLAFLNSIECPSQNGTLKCSRICQGDEEREIQKIPVHLNIRKKGSFKIPFGIPRSPTSLVFDCEVTIQHPRLVIDGDNADTALDLETTSSTSLIFTVKIDFMDGTADIILLSSIPSQVHGPFPIGEEQDVKDDSATSTQPQITLPSLKKAKSQRLNRSGGWYMKSPETGMFAEMDEYTGSPL